MGRTIGKVLLQAFIIVAGAGAVAVVTNLARSDGIPLVAEVEYDIFAKCEDSEADSQAVDAAQLAERGDRILYVDARPADLYSAERVAGSINVPFTSVLSGADPEDLARVAQAAKEAAEVVVYGTFPDPYAPGEEVDVGRSLAEQLIEAGVEEVRHVEGGLEVLKKSGIQTVKGEGGRP